MLDYMDFYKVYVLALEGGKFYVGITKELARRYAEHKNGMGASFTRQNKPICIVYTHNTKTKIKKEAEVHEQRVTIDLMKKYGIDNVRGGEFCQISSQSIINNMRKSVYESIIQSDSLRVKKSYSGIDKIIEGLAAGTMKVRIDGTVKKTNKLSGEMNKSEVVASKKYHSHSRKKNKKINFWWEE